MKDQPDQPEPLSDDEIAAMLEKPRKGKRKPEEPAPRWPEAFYYYVYVLALTAIVLGLWGYMQRDSSELLQGPTLESPILEQITHHLGAIYSGLVAVLADSWWMPLGIAGAAASVFVPRTPRDRKRLTTMLCGIIVTVFLVLIALQFADGVGMPSGY